MRIRYFRLQLFFYLVKTRTNFTQPESFGIDRLHNFYVNVEPQVFLGIWHFRSPLIEDRSFSDDEEYFLKHISEVPSTIPIIIYFHGNAFDRSLTHRRELCRRLRDELKYDVVTFDYRGFGDSNGEPTEQNLFKDARFVYNWLHKLSFGQRRIYLWGHSLGSSVASQLAAQLSADESKSLAGLIMEAPFINIHQAILTHWFSIPFRWQPWYYGLVEKALRSNKLSFETGIHLSKMNCPCVLLHADDDLTVPYIHSRELLQAALNTRNHNMLTKKLFHFKIDMISYHRSGYGHKQIYEAPKLISTLKHVIFEEDL